MNYPVRLPRGLACGALLALAGCHIPPPSKPEPGATVPANFNGAISAESSARLKLDEFYSDRILTGLIRQTLAGNQELKILAQDVRIAGNEYQARRGALFPFVTVRGDAGFDRSSRFTRNGAVDDSLTITPGGKPIPKTLPDFLVAANFTWQIDIWRKLRNARDAASLRYLGTAEGRNYTVTRIVAQVAENYYALLALDARLQVLDGTIALQERSLEIAKARKEAGRGTELGVQRFQAEVRRNQSEKLIVRQEIVETENRINFLAGRFPQAVERPTVNFFDLDSEPLSVGVPSQLLLNRADIRQAERELTAAGLEVLAARAEFFPSLDLTGGVGFEAFNPRYLFNPEAFVANAAGGLVAPLVNRTAIQAVYGTADARQLQAVYNYQRVVLDAFTEVVNRVSAVENYRKSVEIKKQQLEALQSSVDVANRLFQGARAEYIEVLTAQRDFLEARTVLIETKRQQLTAVVNAYQALGGGGDPLAAFDPAQVAVALAPAGPAQTPTPPGPKPAPAPAPASGPVPQVPAPDAPAKPVDAPAKPAPAADPVRP